MCVSLTLKSTINLFERINRDCKFEGLVEIPLDNKPNHIKYYREHMQNLNYEPAVIIEFTNWLKTQEASK